MKRFMIVFIIGMFMLVGCSGKPDPEPDASDNFSEFDGAPSWVIDGGANEAGIAAVGSANIGGAGLQFARTEASANARDELARQVSVKVQNMVKNFAQTTGIGDDETVDKVASQVSRQVADETLVGSKQQSSWISKKQNIFILISIDSESVKDAVSNSVTTSYKNEQALWQQFQAQKAQDELDAFVNQEFGD